MKHIKRILKIATVTLLAIISLSTLCFAGGNDGYNGGEGDTDDTHGTTDQFLPEEQGLGFSVNATGYRFYIVEYSTDEYNTTELVDVITKRPVDIYMTSPNKEGYLIVRNNTIKEEYSTGITDDFFLDDKITVSMTGKYRGIDTYVKTEFELTSSMPAPIVYSNPNFLPNGQAFREWMLTPYDGGDSVGIDNNGTAMIKQLWGDEMLEKFLENDTYRLVVEPIVWSSMYKFESDELGSYWTTVPGKIFLGTAQEWAYYMATTGDKSGQGLSTDYEGKPCFISVIYANALPRSMVIETTNSKFPVPSGGTERLRASQIMHDGYGEHVFRAVDLAGDILATTQTYDSKLGTKIGPPPRAPKIFT